MERHSSIPDTSGAGGRFRTNCAFCGGSGHLLALGLNGQGVIVGCTECAGLSIPPASAEDELAHEQAAVA